MEKQSREVNQILGTQPALGPVPSHLVFPWAICLLVALFAGQALGLGWLWTGILGACMGAVWWILTGSTPWRFQSKFYSPPNWVRGYAPHESLLESKPRQSGRRA